MSTVTLMALTSAAVVALFVALAVYVLAIARTLERIGGEPVSYLAKITFGVRAIETETGMLPPQLDRLNGGLGSVAEGLGAVRGTLQDLVADLERQDTDDGIQ